MALNEIIVGIVDAVLNSDLTIMQAPTYSQIFKKKLVTLTAY